MTDFSRARRMMVDGQIRPRSITDLALIDAMSETPRELFVAGGQEATAYLDRDAPLPSSSGPARFLLKPATIATLIQSAHVGPGDRVLDVGCGTGYAAMILAKLCAKVVALEADGGLAARATDLLGRRAGGDVKVVNAPFEQGVAGEAPYDVIIVEGMLRSLPQFLFSQLKQGGRLVAVIGGDQIGKITVFTYVHGEVSGRPLADAQAPPLMASAGAPSFVF